MMSKIAIIIGLASPLLAVQVVKGVLFILSKLYELVSDTLPSDATIVQSAIDLTTGHATWVAIALATYAIYMTRARHKSAMRQLLSAAGWAAALVTPASLYLLR